jgi:hypothetical protein
MGWFASRFGSNDLGAVSQIREHRSRASYRDPLDRTVFGSGCRVWIPTASIDGRSRIEAGGSNAVTT